LQEVRDEVELRGFFRIDGIELPCFCSAAVRDKVDAARAEREEKQREADAMYASARERDLRIRARMAAKAA
jgi:hypothetical protein